MRFTGTAAERYRAAYLGCDASPPPKVEADLGVAIGDPDAAAQALAYGYRAAYRQAVYEGCLDALLDLPSQV